MKLGLAFSTKNHPELRAESLPRVTLNPLGLHIIDGSDDVWRPGAARSLKWYTFHSNIKGGPDVAIVYALTMMLRHEDNYTHVGLLEQDVLLDKYWCTATMALFDNPEGLPVGAVSARSFEDRVLIQRDGHAVMHNAGAGHIIFTREAAQIVLANYRTGWWPENRAVFSQLSGLDIGKFAAFHHNEQFVTADWSWDTILAAHGLATVALTPSKATMIGQVPSLEQQGLHLVTEPVNRISNALNEDAFILFRNNLQHIRAGECTIAPVDHLLRTRGGAVIFPHHADKHGGLFSGTWKTKWAQGFGPFMYRAESDAVFSMPVFGPCAFHVGGGPVKLHDTATGYRTEIDLSQQTEMITLAVPRDIQTGIVRLEFGPGACLAGIETTHVQPVWRDVMFDYSKLPEVAT